ncbi:MAG TPA: PRC-barrel domain-containing protein [Actinomycetes bacterium]|nr:PRC-barrel domain-containing protein [Actinomycetes bacterium]
MPTIDMVQDWRGRTLLDSAGGRVGSIQEIYLDARTDEPEWVLVHTGLFGMKSSFVPIQQAALDGSDVRVPYRKQQIKDAPRVEPDGELSETEEAELYRHYGMDAEGGSGAPAPEEAPPPAFEAGVPGIGIVGAPPGGGPDLGGPDLGGADLGGADHPAELGEPARSGGRLRRYVATGLPPDREPGAPAAAGGAADRTAEEDLAEDRRGERGGLDGS